MDIGERKRKRTTHSRRSVIGETVLRIYNASFEKSNISSSGKGSYARV